jgi:hypothetical protein
MTDLAALVEAATAAGIVCQFYPGGAVVFGPPHRLRQHAALAEHLRAHREAIGQQLRRAGLGGETDRTWLEYYRLYTPPLRAHQREEDA